MKENEIKKTGIILCSHFERRKKSNFVACCNATVIVQSATRGVRSSSIWKLEAKFLIITIDSRDHMFFSMYNPSEAKGEDLVDQAPPLEIGILTFS